MKLYTCLYEDTEAVMVFDAARGLLCPITSYGLHEDSMNALIKSGAWQKLPDLISQFPDATGISITEAKILAPIPKPKQDVICLGMNYAKHLEESRNYKKASFNRDDEWAVYFSKRVHRATAPGGKVKLYPGLVDGLDYETEVAVIIGKDAFEVQPEKAFDYVMGYTIINDISARNLQGRHKQWYFGKSLDTFTPMGPCIVTADEYATPPQMWLKTWINGELRQDGTLDLLLFDIPHIISELSQGMTLEAGTIIATGTPDGVGLGFDPPKYLKHGDIIRSEVAGIGVLENTVD